MVVLPARLQISIVAPSGKQLHCEEEYIIYGSGNAKEQPIKMRPSSFHGYLNPCTFKKDLPKQVRIEVQINVRCSVRPDRFQNVLIKCPPFNVMQ